MTPGPNLKFGTLILVVAFAVSAVSLYGGARLLDDPPVQAEEAVEADTGTPGGPVTIRLVAQALRFDKRSVAASPNVEVTIQLDNQDAGVLHNVAFYTNNRATQSIFVGQTFPGPAVVEEKFTSPPNPGNYYFRCDVHPDTMTGTFEVQ
jgi:hypothetical protein